MSDNVATALSSMDTLDTALATHSPIQLTFEHKFDQVQILPDNPDLVPEFSSRSGSVERGGAVWRGVLRV